MNLISEWHPHTWPERLLRKSDSLYEVTVGGEPAAYVWFSPVMSEDRMGELHACCSPKHHGRWMSRRLLNRLLQECQVQYDKVLAIHGDPLLANILSRVGFTRMSEHVHVLDFGD